MHTIETIISMEGIRGQCYWKEREGLFMTTEKKTLLISNFIPVVIDVQELENQKLITLKVYISSNEMEVIQIDTQKLRCLDWFEVSPRCVVYSYGKKEAALLKQIVRIQVANCIEEMGKMTYYKEIGWNHDVYGNPTYVFGNMVIGGDCKAVISPALSNFKFEYDENRITEAVQDFMQILKNASQEAAITLGYFFAGLIKALFNEANVPSNFVLYLFGRQQSRKTTIAKMTNNLYCRSSDMDFAVRTVEKTSVAVAEKEISLFKDTTLILDDVAETNDLEYKKVQESVVEKITRFIGNNTRKNVNCGTSIRDYFPNANVIFTGEYVPQFTESTLSRMLLVEIWNPCCDEWLSKLQKQPCLLSTVAYDFIVWVQVHYDEIVSSMQDCFRYYRENQVNLNYQNRLHEHGFVIQYAYKLLFDYLNEKNLIDEDLMAFFSQVPTVIKDILEEQVRIMEKINRTTCERDFCKAFVLLYANQELSIANDKKSFIENQDDGFFVKNGSIAISSTTLWAIMREFYEDTSITLKSVVKQFRANGFLEMDKTGKSTKRIGDSRFLHIRTDMIQEYEDYFLNKTSYKDLYGR